MTSRIHIKIYTVSFRLDTPPPIPEELSSLLNINKLYYERAGRMTFYFFGLEIKKKGFDTVPRNSVTPFAPE